MAKFAPTKDQQRAIDARGSALLISAAAGSGKTKVLTERLMSYITGEDPKSIDSFLVITFTRAAAAELRSRISSAPFKYCLTNLGWNPLIPSIS